MYLKVGNTYDVEFENGRKADIVVVIEKEDDGLVFMVEGGSSCWIDPAKIIACRQIATPQDGD